MVLYAQVDFMEDWFLKLLRDWPGIIFLIILALIVVAASMMPFFRLMGYTLDSWLRPTITAEGTITKKQVQYERSKSWKIWVRVEAKEGSIDVDERFFGSVFYKQPVSVTYVIGRFTGDFYVRKVRLL